MKKMTHQGVTIKLQLWDTAGQERYHSLIPRFIKDSVFAIIVYDISSSKILTNQLDQQSFNNVEMWIEQVRNLRGDETMIALVGNKSDQEDKRVVSGDDGVKKAKAEGILYMETSAKDNTGIESLFNNIVGIIVSSEEQSIAETVHNNGSVIGPVGICLKYNNNRTTKSVRPSVKDCIRRSIKSI